MAPLMDFIVGAFADCHSTGQTCPHTHKLEKKQIPSHPATPRGTPNARHNAGPTYPSLDLCFYLQVLNDDLMATVGCGFLAHNWKLPAYNRASSLSVVFWSRSLTFEAFSPAL